MDPHNHNHHHPQQHPQHHLDMDHDPALAHAQQYGFYPQSDPVDPASYALQFTHPMSNYEVVQAAPPPRQLSASDLQQALHYARPPLGLMPNPQYPNPVYPPSPTNLNPPLSSSSPPPPQSPNAYDPLSPPVSGSDTSAEAIYISRNSSGATSPSSSRGASIAHRNSLRFNPTPSPSGSSARRRGRSVDSDEDEHTNMMSVVQEIAHNRKEATRRQRIEAEQRRRDELRDGYARLKDVLPVSNQKSSKVSLLERATNYIIQLDKTTRQMQTRLAALESEVQRLRALNEKISLSVGNTPEGAVSQGLPVHHLERPLSPPPESVQQQQQQQQQQPPQQQSQQTLSAPHSLVPIQGELPREDSSGSASEGGF